jgi:hypothetical protein
LEAPLPKATNGASEIGATCSHGRRTRSDHPRCSFSTSTSSAARPDAGDSSQLR